MDFSKLARDDYDPNQFQTPEDALLYELGGLTDMSRAGGMKAYFNMGGEGGTGSEKAGECAECAAGTCMEHLGDGEAEALASLSVGEG